jgi:hypothetical protein
MSDTKYNGWTNHETWLVNLWQTNDNGTQDYWEERARECLEYRDFDKDAATQDLADEMQGNVEDFDSDDVTQVMGLYADLLRSALGAVNWFEIAEHYMHDIDVYSAGWNMPGYMPDSEPACFLSDDDARSHLADEMERAADELADERPDDDDNAEPSDEETALREAAEACRDGSGEYGCTVGKWHYFASKV